MSEDFTDTITIGSYLPTVNKRDTITVWVSMPNGVVDSTTTDDTLTKVIFGSGDILMEFVNNSPADTVNNTGPFDISARINTLSGTTVGTVSLHVLTTDKGITTFDTLLMNFDATNNIWQTTVAQKQYRSNIVYSITLTDIAGNVITIIDSFYIKRELLSSSYVIVGTGSNSSFRTPIDFDYNYSWSRQLYLGTEIDSIGKGVTITKLAWDYHDTYPLSYHSQTCYFRAVNFNTLPTTNYQDQAAALALGAVQVWAGTYNMTAQGWMEITLDNPFTLSPGENLLIYWYHNQGSYVAGVGEFQHSLAPNMVAYNHSNTPNFPATGATAYTVRPNLRLFITRKEEISDTSVALVSINSPLSGTVTAGNAVPVQVTIQNKGIGNLSTCIINWTRNGTLQMPFSYTGNLPAASIDTATIGHYMPVPGTVDSITVWVSMPDGVMDVITKDDTLGVSTITCSPSGINGDYVIGHSTSANIPSIGLALSMIKECGISGKVRFLLENGVYTETVDLSSIADKITLQDTLVLTSLLGNNQDVVITSSGIGIILGNSRNIRIEGITVDVAAKGTNAIQFTDACTNIVVRDCKLLANPTSTSNSYNPIYKAQNTGAVDNIFFINNVLDGGYYGFYFYGGTSISAYGSHVVFDSNTLSNQYFYASNTQYVDFTSYSYNIVLSRTTNAGVIWRGINSDYINGTVIGNRILQRSTAITQPAGIYIGYHNVYPTAQVQGRGLIANNEIILNTTGAYYGIYVENAKAEILHNSIYMSGTGTAKGIYIFNGTVNDMAIKNNNIVLTSSTAHPIYFNATGNLNLYDIDYNNLYAPTYTGYYGGNITTMSDWQQAIATDQHSVKIFPDFINPTISLELATYNDSLLCPVAGIQTDITGNIRYNIMTHMGAYIHSPVGQDLMILQISPWNKEVINNQAVQINVDLSNTGIVPITSAALGWSVNGVEQQPAVSWTTTTPLNSLEQQNVPIGTFQANGTDTFNIVVWIKTINGQQDTINTNDTALATAVMYPLAEFITMVEDTIYSLDFDVDAKIRTMTGAPVTPPVLYLETIVNGSSFVYDSILMVLQNNIWQASIPQQYYNSNVIYSLTVSDSIGNKLTLKDSVYIQLAELDKSDTVIIGTETSNYNYTPISMWSNCGWSRQIYLYREIRPDMSPSGTQITKIAWQSVTANANYTNQTCYMRAIDDTTEVTGYLDPLTNGASQVWTGILSILPGWVEITLDTAFYLPANKNLEIIWHDQSGTYTNTNHTWAHTSTSTVYRTLYAQAASFPSTAGTLSYYRPNIKITKADPFTPYTGNDLGLLSFLSPVNNYEELCAVDYEPVKILIANLGENDYDFSVDSIAIQFEITDPRQTKYPGSVSIQTGELASGKTTVIELMTALPVMYQGRYELKAWMESSIDRIAYDDTLVYSYTSGRIGLPIDVDFSGTFPQEFVAQAVNTSALWKIVPQGSEADTAVKPVFGSGMLAFTGNTGAMTHLFTRQLELRGTSLPTLEFWYFHDTLLSDDYMDVRITTDGGTSYTSLLSLFKQNAVYGWQYYRADLTPYINGQCIQILFEAMRMSPGIGSQYIDRIVINSQPDLGISKVNLIVPSACDLSIADLQVEISTITNQIIDLSQFSTSLAVEIPDYQSLAPVPLQMRMGGNSSDIIYISVPNLPAGKYTIKTYLTAPVDNLPGNDTAYYMVDIQPSLSVTVNPVTTVNSRIKVGAEVWQEVVIKNTGNVGISGIELILRITGTNQYIIREPLPVILAAGETYTHTFVNSYIVPEDERYQVYLAAYMACDSALVNTGHAIDEYVDLHNLSIISIDNPIASQSDTVGATVNITVSLANTDDINSFRNVSIFAAIENEEGQTLMNRLGSIEEILPLDTQQFTFGESYTVPEDSVYRIRVYLGKVDNYQENDTVELIRRTIKGTVSVKGIDNANVFTLGQNIPNPANNSTRIDYSVPESGEVVFNLHSISGQLLYSKTIEAPSGKHSLELNTSTFAAGIYFYSIEYKGQRLVKRMMISD